MQLLNLIKVGIIKGWHYMGVMNGEIIRQNKGGGIPPQYLNACCWPYIYDCVIKKVFLDSLTYCNIQLSYFKFKHLLYQIRC